MCGIVGFINIAVDENKITQSIRAIHHRGPDGAGVYQDIKNTVSLGHARLSIVDLTSGTQPLLSIDESIVLVCNGEIYDFEHIREKLERLGHVFQTKTDSEVIIYLYKEYGLTMFEHLRGEFSFLLYDRSQQKVIAARDRFGIKPLYYAQIDNQFIFASEAKAIFASGLFKATISPVKLRDIMSATSVDTIFDGISSVSPGHYIEVNLGETLKSTCYWDLELPKESSEMNLESSKKGVREQFDEAVKLRLRADVPVGVYLSGGIDSSIIAATVAKLSPQKIKAFIVSFPDDKNFDEAKLAQQQAAMIGAKTYTVTCDKYSLAKNIENSLWTSEIPTSNLHGVAKFMLSEMAATHVKVVLTGEGADEVFLGYPFFKGQYQSMSEQLATGKKGDAKQHVKNKALMRLIKKRFGFIPKIEMLRCFDKKFQDFIRYFFSISHRNNLKKTHPIEKVQLSISPNDDFKKLSLAQKRQIYSIKNTLPNYILSLLGDRQEMGHSLEGRVPFLDHKLFEYAKHIPTEQKIYQGQEKYILREAFKERLIPEIYQRTKHPFSASHLWLHKRESDEAKRLINTYLSRKALRNAGIFNVNLIGLVKKINSMMFFNCALKRELNSLLMFVLSVQILHRLMVDDLPRNIASRCNDISLNKHVIHR